MFFIVLLALLHCTVGYEGVIGDLSSVPVVAFERMIIREETEPASDDIMM